MKPTDAQAFDHRQHPRIGVLITNLGTPDAPTAAAVRRYLREFLWDRRVVEIPRLLWWLILHGVILRTRPAKSAAAYADIWTEQGSPLLLHTAAQSTALQTALRGRYGEEVVVDYAMRYGNPGIGEVIDRLCRQGIDRLLVLPLYPQYSGSTSASTFDAVAADFKQRRRLPDLRFVSHYHDHGTYIEALASHIERYWQNHGRADKLVLSYHGVPQFFLDKGDPYHCECHKTTRLLTQRLGLSEAEYCTTFQSRFGRAKWLQPYTDVTLKGLPAQGVKSVQVVCPGFSVDCLETLEEIAVENRDYFLAAGGENYAYIPCLNSNAGHIEALSTIVEEQLGGWTGKQRDVEQTAALASARAAANKEQ